MSDKARSFEAQFKKNLANGMGRRDAMRAAVHANPDGHKAFLDAFNAKHGAARHAPKFARAGR